MKPELEALYEGLCRREPALFEPESLHKQLAGRSTPLRWGFTAAVRLLTK